MGREWLLLGCWVGVSRGDVKKPPGASPVVAVKPRIARGQGRRLVTFCPSAQRQGGQGLARDQRGQQGQTAGPSYG